MECRYRNIIVDYPFELTEILDLGMEASFGEHPVYWLKARIPEKDAESYILNITEDTQLSVYRKTKEEKKKIFCGYTYRVELANEDGYQVICIQAVANTAKLDIQTKSRSFFKQGVTYQQILNTVIKDYPGTQMKEMVKTDRETAFPILQYEETDWEFIKRIAAMFECVVTPDYTEAFPRFYIGKPKGEKARKLDTGAVETCRDLGSCYKDYFKEMQTFSIPKMDEQEKREKEAAKRKEKEKKKKRKKRVKKTKVHQKNLRQNLSLHW